MSGVIIGVMRRTARAVGALLRPALALLRSALAPFAWRDVRASVAWVYQENTLTGDRRAVHLGGGYAACDIGWLRAAGGRGIILGSFSRVEVKRADGA